MPSLWTTSLLVFAFFFAYYIYEPPYRGLYPDLLPEGVVRPCAGRAAPAARGGARRGADRRRRALPRLGALPVPDRGLRRHRGVHGADRLLREDGGHGRVFEGVRAYLRVSWNVVRDAPDVRRFLIVNAALEAAFAGMRTFVVLYITVGLGESLDTSTAVLGVGRGRLRRRGARRRAGRGPLRPRARDARLRLRLRRRARWRRARRAVARVVLADHLLRVDRGRGRDDARLGPALQADARRGPRRRGGAGDVDEGGRACSSGRCWPAPRSTSPGPTSSRRRGTRSSGRSPGFPLLLVLPLLARLSAGRVSGRPAGAPGEQAEAPDLVADDVDGGPRPGVKSSVRA